MNVEVLIYVLNVMLIDFKIGEFICVGYEVKGDKKVCVVKKFGEVIDK